jgi:hypothetical protein
VKDLSDNEAEQIRESGIRDSVKQFGREQQTGETKCAHGKVRAEQVAKNTFFRWCDNCGQSLGI